MNKGYMYSNGKIIIFTEEGALDPIEYVDNIGDILEFQNEIAFLEVALKKDKTTLKDKKYNRESKNKDSILVLGVVAAACAGSALVLPMLMPENAEAIRMSTIVTGAVFAPTMSLMGLTLRPSKKLIRGYEEKIAYEEKTIEILRTELESLTNNPTTIRKELIEDNKNYKIDSEYALKYYRDAIALRFEFGYNPDKFIEWFKDGSLVKRLKEENVADEAIMDFMTFVESRSVELETKKVTKRAKK